MACTTAAARGASHWVPRPFTLDGERAFSLFSLSPCRPGPSSGIVSGPYRLIRVAGYLPAHCPTKRQKTDATLTKGIGFPMRSNEPGAYCVPATTHNAHRTYGVMPPTIGAPCLPTYQCFPTALLAALMFRSRCRNHTSHTAHGGGTIVQSVNEKGDTTCSTRVRVGRLCHMVSWDGLSGSFRLKPKRSSHPTGLARRRGKRKRVLSVPDATVPPPRAPDETYGE
ncbi:hypothetical protein LX32DRAFT_223355 [Colletotrichum zoysiae]|uniref:Uncharacterized protein n=1 Tax=Colletotrichum zoysiae TaxID=1216348 RepID=A0AAD9LVD7_9PEZI|nr:hypothetical protein LX32DRAFT_223355 [Colletotrichum zoysiae]